MKTVFEFQQEAREDLSRPWPVRVNAAGHVLAGRPDAVSLLGFQKTHQQHVDLLFRDLKQHPSEAEGTFPVFVDHDGNVFASLHPIREAWLHAIPDGAETPEPALIPVGTVLVDVLNQTDPVEESNAEGELRRQYGLLRDAVIDAALKCGARHDDADWVMS